MNNIPIAEAIENGVKSLVDKGVVEEDARRILQSISICAISDFITHAKTTIFQEKPAGPDCVSQMEYYLRSWVAFELLVQMSALLPSLNKVSPAIREEVKGIQNVCLQNSAHQEFCLDAVRLLQKAIGKVSLPSPR